METERFDDLTARLARGLTRRRGLGLLAALGAATTLATGAEAGKHKKKKHKKKKPQPCGGACGECQGCFNGACAQVAEGTACGANGACFAGKCLSCPSGKRPVEGECARVCTAPADCVDGGACLKLAADTDTNVNDDRSVCVTVIGSGSSMPDCNSGRSSDCHPGNLCVVFFSAKCAAPA